MALDRHSATPEACAAVDALVARIAAWERDSGERKNQRSRDKLEEFQVAVGAVLADLALAAGRADPYCYRSLRSNAFTNERVSYRPFKAIMAALQALRLVDHKPGFNLRFGGGAGKAKASRWAATDTLRDLLREHGVAEGAARDHFPVLLYTGPAVVLMRHGHWEKGRKIKATEIEYSPTTETKMLAGEMRELDRFVHQHHLEGGAHETYRRDFFCDGHPSAFGWDVGGRFYSIGTDSYQSLPENKRASMRVNGEPVAEIDVKACGVTIYCQLVGLPLDLTGDPYAVPGLERDVAKAWITQALNDATFRKRWAKETPAKIKKWPIAKVQALVLRHIPALTTLPQAGIRGDDLQYLESSTLVATMLRLKRHHAVVSLNMHDGLIVQARHVELAKEVLADEFEKRVGCRLKLVVKRGG